MIVSGALERRVRQWRALSGPRGDIIFRPDAESRDNMANSDLPHADELGVTIAGQPFAPAFITSSWSLQRWEHVGVPLAAKSFTPWPRTCKQGPLVAWRRAAKPPHRQPLSRFP